MVGKSALVLTTALIGSVVPAVNAHPGDHGESRPPLRYRSVHYGFNAPEALSDWSLQSTGPAARRMPLPRLHENQLYLLESWMHSSGAAAAPTPDPRHPREIELRWMLVMNTGTEGMGFAWLDVERYGVLPTIPRPMRAEEVPAPGGDHGQMDYEWGWEAPRLLRAFGVGFDASNPPNRDPFRGSGNIDDRPQHEVSLHWDGLEIVKRTTTADFRDGKPHAVQLNITFVTGGADVTLKLGDEVVYDAYFIPSMTPFAGRPVFGARNTKTAGDVMIDDFTIALLGQSEPREPPLTIVALDHMLNDRAHARNEAVVEFPEDTSRFGRIICRLRLDKPEPRFDPWDRIAHIWIESMEDEGDEESDRVELLRYITPYDRGYAWQADVSDFRPLLRGKKRITQECMTYAEGWVVSVAFDFYPGPPPADRVATDVIPLWSGSPEIGNPDKPVSEFYTQRQVHVPPHAAAAKLRMVVTGHGMSPNSGNAAEFLPIGRTLTINETAYENKLWKDDNYLNPCRPQGGTWKYGRAGWAPGDIVHPWEIEVPKVALQAKELTIEYTLDPYVNENRGQTSPPIHVTEAQLILYR